MFLLYFFVHPLQDDAIWYTLTGMKWPPWFFVINVFCSIINSLCWRSAQGIGNWQKDDEFPNISSYLKSYMVSLKIVVFLELQSQFIWLIFVWGIHEVRYRHRHQRKSQSICHGLTVRYVWHPLRVARIMAVIYHGHEWQQTQKSLRGVDALQAVQRSG